MTEAVSSEALIARASDNPIALALLASVFHARGERKRAVEIALRALGTWPDHAEVRDLISRVFAQQVPDWHFAIVRDGARNAAYEAALKRTITPATKVLEIGTGTGILAMMAARAGAREVISCESEPAIAETAREIVALNGHAGKIRVIAKASTALDVESDLAGRADVLVSEIISNSIMGQNVLAATADAARRLLKPGAQIIPAKGAVRVALARHERGDSRRIGLVDGFDLSPFNRLAPGQYAINGGFRDLSLLSAPADLFEFDFQSGGPFADRRSSVVLTATGDAVNGIAQWIRLTMDDAGAYENEPGTLPFSAWAVVFRPFREGRLIPAGARVRVLGAQERDTIRIWPEFPAG